MGKRLNSSFMFTSPLCTIILAILALFHCYHNSKRKCKIGRIPNSHKISSDIKTTEKAYFAFAYQKLKESESISHPSIKNRQMTFKLQFYAILNKMHLLNIITIFCDGLCALATKNRYKISLASRHSANICDQF